MVPVVCSTLTSQHPWTPGWRRTVQTDSAGAWWAAVEHKLAEGWAIALAVVADVCSAAGNMAKRRAHSLEAVDHEAAEYMAEVRTDTLAAALAAEISRTFDMAREHAGASVVAADIHEAVEHTTPGQADSLAVVVAVDIPSASPP
jgi:hypothetical protein